MNTKKPVHFRKAITNSFVLKVARQLSEKNKQSIQKSFYQLILAGCKAHINNQLDDEFVVIKKSSLKKLDFAIKDAVEEIRKY